MVIGKILIAVVLLGCSKNAVKISGPPVSPTIGATGINVKHKVDTQKIILKDSLHVTAADMGREGVKVFVQESAKSNWFKDILPIFTLLLGILINKGLDYLSDRKKIKKAGKRWHAELLVLESPLEKQIKSLESSLKNHSDTPMENPKVISYAPLDGESFEALDKSELLAYINRYYRKNFQDAVSLSNRINLFVSVMKSHKELLRERFREFLEGHGKKHEKLNANFQELHKSIHAYADALKNEQGEAALHGPFFKPLDELLGLHIVPHIEDGKFNYFELDKTYLIPLISELEKLSTNQRIPPIINYGRSCLDNIKGVKMENEYFAQNLQTIIGFFQEDKKELVKILAELVPKKKWYNF